MLIQIKKDLPNFPDNVIEQWLAPFAETDGWPPVKERWRNLLINTDLGYWRSTKWEWKEVSPNTLQLSPNAENILYQLMRAYAEGENNLYAKSLGERGKERFRFQLHQLIDNGVFLYPPVLVDHGKGFEIMDGNHRLAAYFVWLKWKENAFFLSKLEKQPVTLRVNQPIWFGKVNI